MLVYFDYFALKFAISKLKVNFVGQLKQKKTMEAKDTKEAAKYIADVVNAFKAKNATFKPRHFRDCVTNSSCLYYDKLHSYMVQNGYIIRERDGKDPLSRFTDGLDLGCEVFEEYINWRRGDTIKESKTMEKKSFAIPEGCKSVTVSEESGRLVIEFEEAKKFEPKKGDILAWNTDIEDGVIIFKEFNEDGNATFFACVTKRYENLYLNDFVGYSRPVRWAIASNDQKADVFSALEKEGLKWNAETMEVERIRWKPKDGEKYYYIRNRMKPDNTIWDGGTLDMDLYSIGGVFKTNDECLAAIELIKQTLISYHDKL